MAMSQDRYIKITSTNIGSPEITDRNLNGLIFTKGKGWIYEETAGTVSPMSADKFVECYSTTQVKKYFATTSDEYKSAVRYFAYRSPSGTSPSKLTFARVKVTNSNGDLLVYKQKFQATATAVGTGTVQDKVTVDAKIFGSAIGYKAGSYSFSYSSNSWNYNGEKVKLSLYGISVESGVTASDGDKITVTYVEAVYAWYKGDSEETAPNYEEPVDALERINKDSNDFGSFMYVDLEDYTCKQMKAVATTNATYNYKYLFSVGALNGTTTTIADTTLVKDAEKKAFAKYVGEVNGTCFTYGYDKLSPLLPMAIFGATRYDGVNTATYFMFKQLDGETATISDDGDADELDDLYINYYGLVQVNGQRKSFYQRGVNLDGENTAVYCNEIWLKSRIATEVLDLMLSVEKIWANDNGESLIDNVVTSVANQGVTNGSIEKNKELTNAQKTKVYQLTADAEAWFTVQQQGYYTTTRIQQKQDKPNEYEAVYKLIYSKGDAVSFVEGTHILV